MNGNCMNAPVTHDARLGAYRDANGEVIDYRNVLTVCNAHAALVDALQGALVDDLLEYHAPEWIAKARAALALAGVPADDSH